MKRDESIKVVQKRLRVHPKRLIELKEWMAKRSCIQKHNCLWHVVQGEEGTACMDFCGSIFPKLVDMFDDMCPCHHYTIRTVKKVVKQILAGV